LINRNTEHFITLDIGANIGYYSVLSSVFCPNSTIYAFEPHPVVFKTLQMNASLYKNINPIQCGISDENKTAILYCDNKNIGGHSFLEDGFGKTFNDGHFDETTMYTVESELKTIDSFNIDFEKVKLVKIDVQGLEEKVANYIFSKVPSETLFIIEKFDGWETKLKEFNTKFAFVVPEDKNIIFIKK
jgi:FkbM family methyltransferase